jgi:hypothetical protein
MKDIAECRSLELDGLSYKTAHLEDEIRACKTLATPELWAVEKEIGCRLGMEKYTDEGEKVF